MFISFILTIILLIFINSSNADENGPDLSIQQALNDNLSSNNNNNGEDWHYVCIVDAGSTGSRIHVYKYLKDDDSKSNGLIKVDIKNEQYKKFYPGLSSFEDKPTDIDAMGEYFDPILNFGRDNVPLSKRTDTPLFVLASAGMRKVRERSTKTAQQIIDMAYKYLSESEFIVLKKGIAIIEGADEGLWGWIAANYLNGELENLLHINTPKNIYSQQTTKGVLEMGGESLQITFIPQESSLNALRDHKHGDIVHHIETVNIGEVEFQLFTYSWMGIGMEAAQNRFDSYLATLAQEREASPCYIQGDTRERAHGIGQSITWKGSGNFVECYDGLSDMVDQRLKSKCDIPKIEIKDMMCTPNSILMPKIDLGTITTNEFYYIENFYYTAEVLGLVNVQGQEFLTKLREKGQYYCSLDVEKAKQEFPKASEEEIHKTCFCAAWLLAILNRGYNLENFNKFRVIRDIEGKGNIDWALGYLVAEVPNMDRSTEEWPMTFRFLSIMMVILLMMYCWYKGVISNSDNKLSQTKSWIYNKMGINMSSSPTNNKKDGSNNKYAYQRLNMRRSV